VAWSVALRTVARPTGAAPDVHSRRNQSRQPRRIVVKSPNHPAELGSKRAGDGIKGGRTATLRNVFEKGHGSESGPLRTAGPKPEVAIYYASPDESKQGGAKSQGRQQGWRQEAARNAGARAVPAKDRKPFIRPAQFASTRTTLKTPNGGRESSLLDRAETCRRQPGPCNRRTAW